MTTKRISIIVPLYNEADSLAELCDRVKQAVSKGGFAEYEILFVNDGSTDRSQEVLRTLAVKNSSVKVISFRKNYGKAAALATAFAAARFEYLVTMDADLQDDPAEIPELVEELEKGFDLISGWKKKRHDPISKTLPSKLFNWATSAMSGLRLHDFNCGLKVYRNETAKSLLFYGEMHRYLPVLAHWNGFKVGEKEVVHHPRKFGKSKYGLDRFVNGFLDLFTIVFLRKYNKNPMHLFGLLGVLFLLTGFSVLGYFGVMWLRSGALHIRPLMLMGIGAILMGIQLFSIGLIGEMVTHMGQREEYLVAERINL